MKYRFINFILLFLFIMTSSGCSMVEGIFRAGAWFTILAILIVFALIYVLLTAVGIKPLNFQRVRIDKNKKSKF
ncbi:MAG: hypothetical protein WD016_01515 [Balneolaceae bacterium]